MKVRTRPIPIGGAVSATDCRLEGNSFRFGPINKEYKYLMFTNSESQSDDMFFSFVSKDAKEWCIAYAAVAEDGEPIDLVKTQDTLKRLIKEKDGTDN